MKNVLAICLAMIMLVCMSVTAFAAPDGFVSSPSGTPAPGIVTFDPGHDDCTASLIVTPYADRHGLPETLRTLFEKAYNEIVNAGDLTQLIDSLAKIAADKDIIGTDLSVSDFFFIHATGCDYHDEHVDFDVTLDADTLSRFVGLLQMNENGKWELVSDAQVVNNGEHLTFSVDSFSPFAVVVDNTAGSLIAPQTGHYDLIAIGAILMVLSAVTLGFVLIKRKKENV